MSIRLSVIDDNKPLRLQTHESEDVRLSVGNMIVVKENDYNELRNKPKIETVTLEGNKTFEDLGLSRLTNTELENMLTL